MSDKERITVLHLIGSLHIGGAEQQLVSLAPLFDSSRFRTMVCTMMPGGMLEKQLSTAPKVEIVSLNFRLRSAPLALWRLYRLLKRRKVDVLHMHMYGAALYGRIAGVAASVPVMITTDHGKGLWKKRRQIAFDRFAVRFTDLRIAVSRDIAGILQDRERAPEGKLLVLPNGVDVERFAHDPSARLELRAEWNVPEGAFLIGTLARLVEAKALHILIEAAAAAARTNPRVRLVIVGDGPLKEELNRRAKELNAEELVIFAGPRSDIPRVLSAIDVFALSSIREGLPVSLLEAMAAGKPITATKVGGIPETVRDRQEALLVEPNRPDELAAAILELSANPELAKELGLRAQRRAVRYYSAAATARKLEEVYVDLLGRKSKSTHVGTERA
ncbi:MAG: glycosyltransferase [Armatimonadetes bacterium]|nr:glycosyltransferase [Armatimonadota bacterium]